MEYKRETKYTPGMINTYWKNINDEDVRNYHFNDSQITEIGNEYYVLCVELNKDILKEDV